MKIGRFKKDHDTDTYDVIGGPFENNLFVILETLSDSTNHSALKEFAYNIDPFMLGGNSIDFHAINDEICIHDTFEDPHGKLEEHEECSLAVKMKRNEVIKLLSSWDNLVKKGVEKIVLAMEGDDFKLYEQDDFIKQYGDELIEQEPKIYTLKKQ